MLFVPSCLCGVCEWCVFLVVHIVCVLCLRDLIVCVCLGVSFELCFCMYAVRCCVRGLFV